METAARWQDFLEGGLCVAPFVMGCGRSTPAAETEPEPEPELEPEPEPEPMTSVERATELSRDAFETGLVRLLEVRCGTSLMVPL